MEFEQESFIAKTFEYNKVPFEIGNLVSLYFPNTNSSILASNDDTIYYSYFQGLEGAFRKDKDEPRRYGRVVCDLVKDKFDCMGFFTSDELPKYGISRSKTKELFEIIGKKKGDGKLFAFYLYDHEKSSKIREYLIGLFQTQINAVIEQNSK